VSHALVVVTPVRSRWPGHRPRAVELADAGAVGPPKAAYFEPRPTAGIFTGPMEKLLLSDEPSAPDAAS